MRNKKQVANRKKAQNIKTFPLYSRHYEEATNAGRTNWVQMPQDKLVRMPIQEQKEKNKKKKKKKRPMSKCIVVVFETSHRRICGPLFF